jgi:hypothetical protein
MPGANFYHFKTGKEQQQWGAETNKKDKKKNRMQFEGKRLL